MLKEWNVVNNNNNTLIWKEVTDLSSLDEVQQISNDLNTEALFCKKTNSVVFLTEDDIEINRKLNYSELEMMSRHIEPNQKLNDVLKLL